MIITRIAQDERRVAEFTGATPGQEVTTTHDRIFTDKLLLRENESRLIGIRNNLWEELGLVQGARARLGVAYQDFVRVQIQYPSEFAQIWTNVSLSIFKLTDF